MKQTESNQILPTLNLETENLSVAVPANPPSSGESQLELLEQLFSLSKLILKEFDSITLLPHWPSISSSHKLKSYAYYKQATKGVCVDRLKVDEKWITWKRLGNMSKEQAKIAYIRLTIEILMLFKDISLDEVEIELSKLEKRRTGEEWRFWDSLPLRLEELKRVEEIVVLEPYLSPSSAKLDPKPSTLFQRLRESLNFLYRPRNLLFFLSFLALLRFNSFKAIFSAMRKLVK